MKKIAWTGLGILALIAVPAVAFQMEHGPEGPGGPPKPVTRAEVQAKTQEMFAKFDTNKDGQITKTEFDVGKDAVKAEWLAHRMDYAKDGPGRDGGDRPPHGPGGPGGGRGMMMMGGGHWFERLDTDKNGAVTLAEATAASLAQFDAADTDKDGTLSPDEMHAAHEAARAARRD